MDFSRGHETHVEGGGDVLPPWKEKDGDGVDVEPQNLGELLVGDHDFGTDADNCAKLGGDVEVGGGLTLEELVEEENVEEYVHDAESHQKNPVKIDANF